MGRKTARVNARLEVYARQPGDFGIIRMSEAPRPIEQELAELEEIADQIRRHVDGLPSYPGNGVVAVWDTEATCEFCGSTWTEAYDSPHNGGCCHDDCERMEALADD